MKKDGLAESPARRWTRPDEYIAVLAQQRRARRGRRREARTQPESPRLLLSTLPFAALLSLLAVLAVAIMVIAFPGSQPRPKPKAPQQRQQGVAQRGWFQEAQREMHR